VTKSTGAVHRLMRHSAWLIALVSVACAPANDAGQQKPPHREVVAASQAPLPVFSPAIRSGNLLFLSGQVGNRPGTKEIVEGGISAETTQVLENIRAILDTAGLGLADVVKCTVFLADIGDYKEMNEIYQGYFSSEPPARSTIAAAGLALGATIEIECIAAYPG